MIRSLLISFFLFPIGVFANFSAEISTNNSQISLHDLLEMRVVLTYPEGYHPDINTIRGNLFQHRALTGPPFSLISSEVKNESGKTTLTFDLEPQRVGIHTLSLYEIPFISDNGETIKILSNLQQVKVLPEIPLEIDFKPVLASLSSEYPIEISFENRFRIYDHLAIIKKENQLALQSKTLPWSLIIGGIIFTLLYLIARQQPKENRPKTTSEAIKRTIATKNALKKLGILSSNTPTQAYYINLTNTIREYIEEYHNLPATTATTEEFLQALANYHSFDQNIQKLLKQFLIQSDRVKFAEHNPTSTEKRDALQSAKNFINDTGY